MKLDSKRFQATIGRTIFFVWFISFFVVSSVAQTPNISQLPELPANQTLERGLKGGENVRFKITLKKDEFLQVRIEQKGIDLLLKIFDSDAKELAMMDSPNETDGPEILSFASEVSSVYVFEISSLDPKAAPGKLSIRRETPRNVTEADRFRIKNERVFSEGMTARDKQETELAIRKLVEALTGWDELKESILSEMTWSEIKALGLKSAEVLYADAVKLEKDSSPASRALAISNFELAARLSAEAGNNNLQRSSLSFIAGIYLHSFENQKALNYYNRALSLSREIGDKATEAAALQNIGVVEARFGESPKALETFKQALVLYRTSLNRGGEADALFSIGQLYSRMGSHRIALETLNQALKLFQQTENKKFEGAALNSIAVVYDRLDKKEKALDIYNQAAKIADQIGDTKGKAAATGNIASIYNSLGEIQKALDADNLAISLYRSIGDKKGEAITLLSLGNLYLNIKDENRAIDSYNQSLAINRSLGDRAGEGITLMNLGAAAFMKKNFTAAVDYLNQAMSRLEGTGNRAAEANAFTSLGVAYRDLGNRPKALESFYRSLLIQRNIGRTSGEAATLGALRVLWAMQKNPRLAVFFGKLAIGNLLELRKEISGLDSDTQKTYLKTTEDSYKSLAEILITDNRLAEAQQILSLYQDTQFFDFDPNSRETPKTVVKTPREDILSRRYAALVENVGKAGELAAAFKDELGKSPPTTEESKRLIRLESDYKTRSDEFFAFFKQVEMEFTKPADDSDKLPAATDLADLQSILRETSAAKDQKVVAVYTITNDESFRVLLVTSDGIKAFTSPAPISAAALDEKILKFYGVLQSPKYDAKPLGKELYDIVFGALAKELPKDTTTIIWSLDGNLRYVPMSALWDGEKYLAERFQTVVFTRTDKQRLARPVSASWTGIGFGSSQAHSVDLLGDGDKVSFSALPGVTEELRSIFKTPGNNEGFLGGDVFADNRFTKTAFFDGLSRKRQLVHISSHFSFRPGDDSRSFLLLGDGSALPLNELKLEKNIFDGVELLTLSACNTAATQSDANGREIDGFAELAQRLGAGAVMATLWSVSDASTPWLMRDFYANRESAAGITKSEALRRAQIELINGIAKTKISPAGAKSDGSKTQIIVNENGKRDGNTTRADIVFVTKSEAPLFTIDPKKPFAHPYFWSPFILIGNWR